MPKESSKSGRSTSNARALRRLEPYNSSPTCEDEREHGSRHSSGKKSSRSKGSRSRSRSHSKEPPQWAKELLKNQQENVKELKRLQSEIDGEYKDLPVGGRNHHFDILVIRLNTS